MKIALLPSGALCQGLIHEISVPTKAHSLTRILERNVYVPQVTTRVLCSITDCIPITFGDLIKRTILVMWSFKSRLHIMDFP